MEDIIIAPGNIEIEGLDYISLLDLEIKTSVNDHGYAYLQIEVEENDDTISRANESKIVCIKTTLKEQHNKVLFCGYTEKVEKITGLSHSELRVTLASLSKKLDFTRFDMSFQNKADHYKTIMEKSAKKEEGVNTTIKMKATDKENGDWVLQYHETAWEFIKLQASKLNASVFTDVTDKNNATIYVGVPSGSDIGKDLAVETKEFTSISRVCPFGKAKGAQLTSFYYGCAGTNISVNGQNYVIATSECKLDTVGLRCNYTCYDRDSFEIKEEFHKKMAGHMLKAKVKDVMNDTVKVHLVDIDKNYTEGATKYFEYSTTYASSDGSGFYCMPEKDDIVRIFLATNEEKDAFAASSVNTNPLEKPRDKQWKAPGGKEILLTDKGISIICEKDKIFIDLTSENGISIVSSKPISVKSDKDISVSAGGKVNIEAKKEMAIQVGKSGIQMNSSTLTVGSKGVFIN